MMKLILIVLMVFISHDVKANEENEPLIELLIASKATGMCGNIQQMLAFQESTQMNGGDEFIARFVSTEAARLGKTVSEFVAQCDAAIEIYTKTMKDLDYVK